MRASRKAYLVLVMAAILCAGVGCRKATSGAGALPGSNQVAGWEKTGETRTYAPANLADYIDGGAEQYVQAGVKELVTSDYKFQNKVEATADMYTMSGEGGARTIFDADPAADSRSISLGDAARVYRQSLVFRQGPHLVRIVAYQNGPEVQPALIDLGNAISSRLAK